MAVWFHNQFLNVSLIWPETENEGINCLTACFAVTRDTSSFLSFTGKLFGPCNELFASFRSSFSSK